MALYIPLQTYFPDGNVAKTKLNNLQNEQEGWLSPSERVSFCNQLKAHHLATLRESRRYVVAGASIWLRQESLIKAHPSVFNRFWDIAGRKLRHFHTPPLLAGGDPVGISRRCWYAYAVKKLLTHWYAVHKTRINGLSCGEESMTICSAVLIQYQRVIDRRTSSL